MKLGAVDRLIDRVTLRHEDQQKATQEAWLRKKGLLYHDQTHTPK